jgi:hypothetical protein
MKYVIVYETGSRAIVLPDTIRNALVDVERQVIVDKHDMEKIRNHFAWLKYRIIEWLVDHEYQEVLHA